MKEKERHGWQEEFLFFGQNYPLNTFNSISLFISNQILFYQYFTIYILSLYQYQTQFLPLYQYQREEDMKKCQRRIEELLNKVT